MKLLSTLLALSSIALVSALTLLVTGLISLPAFLAVAMVGFVLLGVHSYTPRRELRMPRRSVAFVAAKSCCG